MQADACNSSRLPCLTDDSTRCEMDRQPSVKTSNVISTSAGKLLVQYERIETSCISLRSASEYLVVRASLCIMLAVRLPVHVRYTSNVYTEVSWRPFWCRFFREPQMRPLGRPRNVRAVPEAPGWFSACRQRALLVTRSRTVLTAKASGFTPFSMSDTQCASTLRSSCVFWTVTESRAIVSKT
jgi:hypothetical protein